MALSRRSSRRASDASHLGRYRGADVTRSAALCAALTYGALPQAATAHARGIPVLSAAPGPPIVRARGGTTGAHAPVLDVANAANSAVASFDDSGDRIHHRVGLGRIGREHRVAFRVGLGALFPNLREDNPSKIVSGFGGTLCLIVSFVYIVVYVALIAVPGLRSVVHKPVLISDAVALTLAVACSALVLCGPLFLAMRRVKNLEF